MRLRQWKLNRKTSWGKLIEGIFMNRGLQFRIAFSFTLISLIPLLALGLFSYYKSAGAIQDIVSQYTSDITNEININIFLNFKDIDDISKMVLNSDPLKEILAQERAETSGDKHGNYLKIISILKSIKFSNDFITSIYILSSKNNMIYAVGDVTGNYGISFLTPEYRANYKKSAIYRETLSEYNNYKWWPPQNVLGQNVFVLTRKLYDMDRGNLGVVVIHVNQNILRNIADRLTHHKNTLLYLIDEEGRFIYHPEIAWMGKKIKDPEILKGVCRSESGSFITHKRKPKLFVVYNTFFVTGWKLVALMPYRQLIAQASTLRNVTIIIFLACFILVLILSLFISGGILNPVRKLNQLMRQGATGDMKVRFNVLYQDEIGDLGVSFNQMMGNIEKLMQMVEEEQQHKVKAQISALEAHINPHFLYNTLASMYWLAMAEGNHKVGQMAVALSNFFRLGLNKGKEFTTVEKEVEHVRSYLSIQKMRFGDKFEYHIQVDPEILQYRTIKLILQPLVENSLVHGIEGLPVPGLIKVSVFKAGEGITFRVLDNGSGIANLDEEGLPKIMNSGYGLKNLQQRLSLYFENDYSLSCTSVPHQETVFEISIPVRSRPEGEEHV